MYKCTNVPMYKCTIVPMYKCTNEQPDAIQLSNNPINKLSTKFPLALTGFGNL